MLLEEVLLVYLVKVRSPSCTTSLLSSRAFAFLMLYWVDSGRVAESFGLYEFGPGVMDVFKPLNFFSRPMTPPLVMTLFELAEWSEMR